MRYSERDAGSQVVQQRGRAPWYRSVGQRCARIAAETLASQLPRRARPARYSQDIDDIRRDNEALLIS